MKKITYLLSLLLCLALGTMNAEAQIWVDGNGSAALGTASGGQYTYHSGEFTPGSTPTKLRFVFLATSTSGMDTSGKHPHVHFAEFYLYDASGAQVTLEASNFSSNATETAEGSIDQLCNGSTTKQDGQGNYAWYWHSMWNSTPNCDHYLEVTIPSGTDLSKFAYGFVSRNTSCIPTKIMILNGGENIAAHDALNTEEQELERNYLSVYSSDGGRAERAWAAVKAAFQGGNTNPDIAELETAKADMVLTRQSPFYTLSIDGSLTSASDPTRKVYDGSGSTFTVPAGTSTMRMAVSATNSGAKSNEHVFFTLSELTVNLNGTALDLANANLTSNADHNTINPDSKDGSGLPALYDGDVNTYFHSAYKNAPAADHYLEFSLGSALESDGSMYISFDSRNNSNVPTIIEFYNPDEASHYEALAALNQRTGTLLAGPFGTEPGQYDQEKIIEATDAALVVLRNTTATTEEVNAALEALNVAAEGAMVLFEDNTKVIIGNKQHTTRFVYVRSDNELGAGTAKDSYTYIWTLKKAGTHKFKLYNEYTGKYVGAVPDGNNQRFSMVDEANAQIFTIAATDGSFYNIYDADYSDKDRCALHAVDWDGVVRWGLAAEASKFSFITDLTGTDELFANALIAKVAALKGDKFGNLSDDNAEIDRKADDLQTTPSMELFRDLEAAIASGNCVLPEAGKIYQIVSQTEASASGNGRRDPGDLLCAEPTAAGADRYVEGTDRQIKHKQPENVHIPNSYWMFEKAEANNQVYLRHLNSGLYAGQLPNNSNAQLPLSKDHAGKYSFSYLTEHSCYMLFDEVGQSYLHSANSSSNVIGYNVATENASRWTVVEVSTVPVTISAVKYATLNLPFAVNIPEHVEAYIGKEEGESVIKLEKIAGNVIPANTAVILVSTEDLPEAKTYQFAVAYGNTDAAPENKLSGTTTAETIADGAEAYILKNGGAGIGLYKVTSATDRTIPANKAYFGATYVSEESAPAMFGFSFGNLTSIKNLETNGQAAETFYDLRGRRVLNPTHGVFVKANGEKVYIK